MTDLEIVNKTAAGDINEIATKLGLSSSQYVMYGENKAKVLLEPTQKRGKLILVTAINPTPYGEGKTTVSIGLADAFQALGEHVCLSLREPSLGPVFGMKGGATGGGYSQVLPMVDINLHFTGDFHAITAANNLISAAIYNHIAHGNSLGITDVVFDRCLDVNDRTLRNIEFTCAGKSYTDHFRITSASEIMALFCLASDMNDLKMRLGRIIVGFTENKKAITVHDLKLEGALTVLLKEAFSPNLVQTLEQTPALIHGGPFANIAHGCSSIKATNLALELSDYVITEAGFGSDLGAEKFLDIVCPVAGYQPNAIVLVATIRALKYHGKNDLASGLCNLQAHLDHLENYQVPIIVCLNRFADDTDLDIEVVQNYCQKVGVCCEVSTAYALGGKGAINLAKTVRAHANSCSNFQPLVTNQMTIDEKLTELSHKVYHVKEIVYSDTAKEKLAIIDQLGLSYLPVCVAKTQYSISDDKKLLGYPEASMMTVSDIVLHQGAGFITVLLGDIMTMPGLPLSPNYEKIDIVNGEITGIF